MFVIISPAKKIALTSSYAGGSSEIRFFKQSLELANICTQFSQEQLEQFMKISPKLAALNKERWLNFTTNIKDGQIALLLFQGDVYKGLDATSFSSENYNYAQAHLAILSGLYGLLRPLDKIAPYRLEMGSKIPLNDFKNLYQFWDNKITEQLILDIGTSKLLVNLASNEYFKAVNTKLLKAANIKIVTPIFKDYKNGEYKVISFYAKAARGMLARYIIENKLTDVNQLKDFTCNGYKYHESLDNEIIFYRKL